jgi:hypothetical protein
VATKVLSQCLLLLLLVSCAARGKRYADIQVQPPLPEGEFLILGFLGGREPWDSRTSSVRKTALELRQVGNPGVHVETFENQKRGLALRLVREILDHDQNGALDQEERDSARLILYGQSFGGAATVKFARQLYELDIPVLLNIQIDSVGLGDERIPPNVKRAANLYQPNGIFIKGEPRIRADDPTRTEIIGNFEYDYSEKEIDISFVPWFKKIFRSSHTKMNYDPDVWERVKSLILKEIRPRMSHER